MTAADQRRGGRGARSRFCLGQRGFGLLLHPTSLPGRHGCGDLGSAARGFVDFLSAAGARWWQMLPVGPPGPGNSPYSALSAFAGSPLLVNLDELVEQGLLAVRDVRRPAGFRAERVCFGAVTRYRLARLRSAFAVFAHGGGLTCRPFVRYREQHTDWLDDYALYRAIGRVNRNQPWHTWDVKLRRRHKVTLRRTRAELRNQIDFECFVQYQFDRQWSALRKYAARAGVGLIGDIPIFVAHDSSDVWAHPELFKLDADGQPTIVSGVPPDAFSRVGQLWEHPHYRWSRHAASGFAWWKARFSRTLSQFDAVRVDHFLGFHRAWAVPGRARTARRGRWIKTPGRELFTAVRRALGRVEIIAEDLGLVTKEATALREHFGFRGMRVLQCAFGDDKGGRYHQPHGYPRECVVYPGTHDNETTAGWFERLRRVGAGRRGASDSSEAERVLRYTGTAGRAIHWDITRLAMMSPADTAIIPVQDLLGLGNEARMNNPARVTGNWRWRLLAGRLSPRIARRLHDLAESYDRLSR